MSFLQTIKESVSLGTGTSGSINGASKLIRRPGNVATGPYQDMNLSFPPTSHIEFRFPVAALVPQNRCTSQDPKQEASDKTPRAGGLGCIRFNTVQLLQVNKVSILKHLDKVQTIDTTRVHNHKEIDSAHGIKFLACARYGRTWPLKWSMQKITK